MEMGGQVFMKFEFSYQHKGAISEDMLLLIIKNES